MHQQRRQVFFVASLALFSCNIIGGAQGFVAPESPLSSSWRRKASPPSSPLFPPPPLCATANDRGEENKKNKTLYDILNASPTDTPQQLRRKYTDAARRTHPDAALSSSSVDEAGADFRDIAAAWGVLSDPKKRLQYDRSLKAKEFTSSMGSLIDSGLGAAFPFLFETAPQRLNRTATDLGKTMQDVGERLEKTRTVAQLNLRSSDLVQRAAKHTNRAKEIQTRLQSDRRVKALQNSADEELTSTQANRIIQGFEFLDDVGEAVSKTVDALAQVEGEYDERTKAHQSAQRDLTSAEQKVDAARRDQQLAEERLKETRQKLKDTETQRKKIEVDRDEKIRVQQRTEKDLTLVERTMESARREEKLARERWEEAQRRFDEAEAQRKQVEGEYNDKMREQQRIQKDLTLTEQNIDSARQTEQKVKGQLEETRQNVEETQTALNQYNQDLSLMEQQVNQSASRLGKLSASLKQQRDATRRALRQREDLNISKENAYLKEESKRLEGVAAKLLAKAEELRLKANKFSNE